VLGQAIPHSRRQVVPGQQPAVAPAEEYDHPPRIRPVRLKNILDRPVSRIRRQGSDTFGSSPGQQRCMGTQPPLCDGMQDGAHDKELHKRCDDEDSQKGSGEGPEQAACA
jgi:hypothetical protein